MAKLTKRKKQILEMIEGIEQPSSSMDAIKKFQKVELQ